MARLGLVGPPWWAIALRGGLGILVGLIAITMPMVALGSLLLVLAVYLAIDGVLAIIASMRAARHGERWAWLGIEGLLDLGAAAIVLFMPGITLVVVVWLIAGWAVISGGAMLVAAWQAQNGRIWLALGGALSIAWGALLFLSPITGAVVLAWWFGLYALAFGFVLLVMGFRIRRRHAERAAA
jgi:uncharacterized membrane protein HdeD (DUF308 family)